MENNLLTEITDFKNDVKCNGMCISTYLNKRKEFLQRIELSSEQNQVFFQTFVLFIVFDKLKVDQKITIL